MGTVLVGGMVRRLPRPSAALAPLSSLQGRPRGWRTSASARSLRQAARGTCHSTTLQSGGRANEPLVYSVRRTATRASHPIAGMRRARPTGAGGVNLPAARPAGLPQLGYPHATSARHPEPQPAGRRVRAALLPSEHHVTHAPEYHRVRRAGVQRPTLQLRASERRPAGRLWERARYSPGTKARTASSPCGPRGRLRACLRSCLALASAVLSSLIRCEFCCTAQRCRRPRPSCAAGPAQ